MGIAQYLKEDHKAVAASPANGPSNGSVDAPKASKGISGTKLGILAGTLILWGLASPFLEFTGNVGSAAIGLFILFIGLRIAWTITSARRLDVDGPYGATGP
jgi:hypothetical protein